MARLLKLGVGVTAVGAGLCWYHGLLPPPPIVDKPFPKSTLLVRDVQASMYKVNSEFEKTEKEAPEGISGKQLKMVGFYHDNPKELADPTKGRMSIGYFLENEEQRKRAREFQGKPGWRIIEVPESKAKYSIFQHMGDLGYMIMAFHWVNFHKVEEKEKLNASKTGIETYDYRISSKMMREMYRPYENNHVFEATPFPQPDLKASKNQTKNV